MANDPRVNIFCDTHIWNELCVVSRFESVLVGGLKSDRMIINWLLLLPMCWPDRHISAAKQRACSLTHSSGCTALSDNFPAVAPVDWCSATLLTPSGALRRVVSHKRWCIKLHKKPRCNHRALNCQCPWDGLKNCLKGIGNTWVFSSEDDT